MGRNLGRGGRFAPAILAAACALLGVTLPSGADAAKVWILDQDEDESLDDLW